MSLDTEALIKAADAGDAESCHRLAFLYSLGRDDIPQDKSKAFLYYMKGHAFGHPLCAQPLAMFYLSGKEVAKDVGKALELLEEGYSKHGDLQAGHDLARIHLIGNDIPKNEEKACAIFKQIFELSLDLAAANTISSTLKVISNILYYPLCVLYGRGCPQDKEQGIRLLEQAAEHGFFMAKRLLETQEIEDPLVCLDFFGDDYIANAETKNISHLINRTVQQ